MHQNKTHFAGVVRDIVRTCIVLLCHHVDGKANVLDVISSYQTVRSEE